MRIYEFARENNTTSKEILAILTEGGFSGLTHMSQLTSDALALVQSKAGKAAPKAPSPKTAAHKPTTVKPAPAKPAAPAVAKPVAPAVAKPAPAKPAPQKATVKPKTSSRNARKRRPVPQAPEVITEIIVAGGLPLHEAADMMGKQSGELIVSLLREGLVCNRNQVITKEQITSLAQSFGLTVKQPEKSAQKETIEAASGVEVSRFPVVVIMGHVDHGKTTLLDYLRKTNVAAREAGGITQALGAYEVESAHGKIVFLDTPGHAAFTHMRKRGTQVTDMVVLMVAADDGIMPQTDEAINCAKAAGVPIIVAINKVDKAQSAAAIQTIKRQLADRDLLTEDWGGEVVCIPISAKTGLGVDELLEMIVLQGQLLELKSHPEADVRAFVLEANVEKGHGAVASVMCTQGTLKQGDYFVCGNVTGKARLLIDSYGKKVAQAGPSIPVKVVGFDALPSSSEVLEVISYNDYLKVRSGKVSASSFLSRGDVVSAQYVIPIMLKGDTFGSLEAVLGAIDKLNKNAPEGAPLIKVLSSTVGDVTQGDIERALDTSARLVCMNVKVERNAALHAKEFNAQVIHHDVIYHLLEELEALQIKGVKKKKIEKKLGEAIVRKVFDVKGLGVIAGCYVQSGLFVEKTKVQCFRRGEYLGEGKITSLQKERKNVKEVRSGSECGFICDGFSDWQEDDIVHCITTVEE